MKDKLALFRLVTSAKLLFLAVPACPADTSYRLSQIIRRISINQLLSPLFTLGRLLLLCQTCSACIPQSWVVFLRCTVCFMKGATHPCVPLTLFGKDTLRYNFPGFLPEIPLFCLLSSTQRQASQTGQASSHLSGSTIPVLSLLLVKFLSLEGSLPHCHEQITYQLPRKPGRESPSS